MYVIQHCFICSLSDSTVSEDAGIESWTVATLALTSRSSNHSARSHLLSARSHPHSARSHLKKYINMYCQSRGFPRFAALFIKSQFVTSKLQI
jgi:hypothetical protein